MGIFDYQDSTTEKIGTVESVDTANIIIKIDNEELLKKCSITAYLSDEPLYEKLRLICFALDAEFKVKDNTITILTKGC